MTREGRGRGGRIINLYQGIAVGGSQHFRSKKTGDEKYDRFWTRDSVLSLAYVSVSG